MWRRRKTNASYAALIVGGTIAFVSVNFALGTRAEAQTNPVATGGQAGSSKGAAAVGTEVKDKNFDLGNVSKALVDEASRLSNDAAGWGRKLQELELEFNKNQRDDETIAKNVDETLIVLRAAASRLAPDAEARVTLRKKRVPFESLRAGRRCIRTRRSVSRPVISNKRLRSCTL